MSPSRIPRPGAAPTSTDPRSPGSAIRSTPNSPAQAPASSGFKPNNPFAQRSLIPPTQSPSPPGRIPQPYPHPQAQAHSQALPKRRPKPPSPEDDGSTPSPQQLRRPAPNMGSPDTGLPRPRGGPGLPRSCLRQPSTPALTSIPRSVPTNDSPKTRARAASAAADGRPPTLPVEHPPMPLLFEPSFADSREPSVPPHIRVRLRLIHHLGVVLGIDASGISSKIDVPVLLARVDAAYDRGHQGTGSGGVISLPLPLRPMAMAMTERTSIGMVSGGVGMGMGKGGRVGGTGMLNRLKRFGRKSLDEPGTSGVGGTPAFSSASVEGPAFGVAMNEAPPGSWCTSLTGGQRHELPLIVFTVVEEIYRRGMSQPGFFRLAGDGTRISHLTKVFNLPPLYGDSLSIASEPIHILTGLHKRYIRDLPEPILDESVFAAFPAFCAEPEPGSLALPLSTRITAAQILLKLLPPLHFSLFIYLLAFLGQLPLFPDNRLNVESISIIFGPAMCAPRGKGISGLGPSASERGVEPDPEEVSNLVNQSARSAFRDGEAVESPRKEKGGDPKIDPRLLSPIDLRSATDTSPFARLRTESTPSSTTSTEPSPTSKTPGSIDISRFSSSSSTTTFSDTAEAGSVSPPTSASASGNGIFARAFSSMSIASDAKGGLEAVPKRSASFTSLSSLVRKGGAIMGKGGSTSTRTLSGEALEPPKASVNPQITNVLGSLHDLLVSKDKQIERDARELALLRHTLLETDEKLQRATSTSPSPTPTTPAITITSTPLIKTFEVTDLQTQLTTTLAALETARLQSRKSAERMLDVEARLARADPEKRLKRGNLGVALALEQARVVRLIEERDLARDRLEKVKTTLFSVA